MSSSDFMHVVNWWFITFLIGIAWFPFISRFFSAFFDKGYIFSKVIGIIAVTYSVFVFGFFHVLPFTKNNSLVIASCMSLAFLFFGRKSISELRKWKILLFEEALFFVSLWFWSYIKTFQPDIHGLEKYMDFGFINSILRSSYFPPKDMWFPPFPINYYYFGHLVTGVLTKLSGIPSYITFNLMLCTIFAFCVTESFSIGFQFAYRMGKGFSLKKSFFVGIITGFLITFAGNIHTIYAFFKPYTGENPPPFWNLPFSPFTFYNSYWYPNATRFIYHTIHEFPMYSFVVSDLHGHVLDIPVVLLIIGLLLNLIVKKTKPSAQESLLLGFTLAVGYMTNAWDGLIYFLLTCAVFLYSYRTTIIHLTKKAKIKIFSFSENPFAPILLVILTFICVLIPFNHYFKPFVSGIGVLCSPKFLTDIGKVGPLLFEADHCQRSPIWQLGILWGFFFFWVISFVIMLRKKQKDATDVFIIICSSLSLILIVIPEFLYAKDIYPAHYRANTMFKLVYQSFIMLSLSSIYIISRVIPTIRGWALSHPEKRGLLYIAYLLVSLIIFSLVSIYPFFAISAYFNNLKTPVGLNGINYLRTLYPDDYKAIGWINSNISGQPVLLEMQGDSYTDAERISANTGLPTVLGWTVHEWLWRGSYSVDAPRIIDVTTLYESNDVEKTKELIKKYNIKYVYIGQLERAKYADLRENKLLGLGKIVFQSGSTEIIKLNRI